MNTRQLKALQLVATGKISGENGSYRVPSQSSNAFYTVSLEGEPSCTCADFELTKKECKHILAARYWLSEQTTGISTEKPNPAAKIPRKTYKQDWPAYNLAQTTEKKWFLKLLSDVCQQLPEPKPKRGRPTVPLGDAAFAACYKVYSGFSARRFTCDLEEAAKAGHMEKAIHFNSVLKSIESEGMTSVLTELIGQTAAPLKGIENEFAVDSSGFSGCRFFRWYDEKYGTPRQESEWVKAHICCGTRTNVIAAAQVLEKNSGDSPQLPELVADTSINFEMKQVSADKAYASKANFNTIAAVGAEPFIAFKSNATGAVGGLFGKAFHYFSFHREEFLEHYHRRSMVESTFSMVKRKFGDSVRGKNDVAMRNEVLAKFVCHNICCLVAAIYEQGLSPVFGLTKEEDDEEAAILKFPAAS